MADTWTEYLCAKPGNGGITLGICTRELLCEIPQEWFGDDGDPLPEFSDEHGELRVPEEYDGRKIHGHDGEYLLGELGTWTNDNSAFVSELSSENVRQSLLRLNWDVACTGEVCAKLLPIWTDLVDHSPLDF